MFSFTVSAAGIGTDILRVLRPGAYRFTDDAGSTVVSEIQKILNVPPQRHGKIYPRRARLGLSIARGSLAGNKGRARIRTNIYRASAPGEAPAPDTKEYLESWSHTVERDGLGFNAAVSSPLWFRFGRRLEFGGGDRRGVYIEPRPHARVAIERVDAAIQSGLIRFDLGILETPLT